jgi:hypothetical protein
MTSPVEGRRFPDDPDSVAEKTDELVGKYAHI